MVTIANGKWIADLKAMTCRNYIEGITVVFRKEGNIFVGKIQDMPISLFAKWASMPNGEKKVAKIIFDAEDVFLRAYYESKNEEKKGTQYKLC